MFRSPYVSTRLRRSTRSRVPVFEREARVQYFVTFDDNSKQYSWYLREDDENILELVSDTVIFEDMTKVLALRARTPGVEYNEKSFK